MAKKTTALLETETPEKREEVIPKEIKTKVDKGDVALYKAEIKRLEDMLKEKNHIISNLQAANEQISHELSEARKK